MAKRGRLAGVFSGVLASLRSAESELERQLAGIKRAISSLEFGGSPAPGRTSGRRMDRRSATTVAPRKRRKLSAKARAAISRAQKKRWAKLKAES
jgi:hypothetical protein